MVRVVGLKLTMCHVDKTGRRFDVMWSRCQRPTPHSGLGALKVRSCRPGGGIQKALTKLGAAAESETI